MAGCGGPLYFCLLLRVFSIQQQICYMKKNMSYVKKNFKNTFSTILTFDGGRFILLYVFPAILEFSKIAIF